VNGVWTTVIVVGVATVTFKSAGPVLLGGRPLPAKLAAVVELLAPALLAALVVTQTLGGDEEVVVDARLAGVAAAAVALLLRAPILVVVGVAAATKALARGLS
jgi:branched-subunit amino acid transport protein